MFKEQYEQKPSHSMHEGPPGDYKRAQAEILFHFSLHLNQSKRFLGRHAHTQLAGVLCSLYVVVEAPEEGHLFQCL